MRTATAESAPYAPASTVSFIAPQPIAEGIAAVLRERITLGVYPPGSWIREQMLGQEFSVSNGPIREALQMLVNEELLVREPHRGVRVVTLDNDEIVEIFQMRLALLELAAELTAKRATNEQISEANKLLVEMAHVLAQGDIDAQMSLGGQLSQWLCSCSGNAKLAQNWGRLTNQSRMYIHESLRRSKQLDKVSKLWRALVDAIRMRDPQDARAAVRGLVCRALEDLGLPVEPLSPVSIDSSFPPAE